MNAAQARHAAEVALPGFAIGMAGGVLIGLLGMVGGMSAGQALAATLVLGLPLALFGALYDGLLAGGRLSIGTLAPAVVFWLPLFPLARYLNEVFADVMAGGPVSISGGVAGFLAYQAILSLGYAIGFVFLHEQLAPLWWLRVRAHNPAVARLMERYVAHAEALHQQGRRGRMPSQEIQSQEIQSQEIQSQKVRNQKVQSPKT